MYYTLPLVKPLLPVDYQILIALIHDERHGYHITNICYNDSKGRIALTGGMTYSALARLQDSGLINATGTQRGSGSSHDRISYAITIAGHEALLAETLRLEHATQLARRRL